jgi:cytochrome c oxidase subunit 2
MERRNVGGIAKFRSPAGGARRLRRHAVLVMLVLGASALAGCSQGDVESLKRLGMPEAASDRAVPMHELWVNTWIAAGIIGVFVWGLMIWCMVVYRKRKGHDQLPRQNRYNLPMEVLYTLAPFIIIGVLFYYTIAVQNDVLAKSEDPQHTINVTGQKWSWTFNYKSADNPAVGEDVWAAGTIEETPDLYLPVGETVHFNLSSPDVNHSFWIPAFAFKLDVIPGRANNFEVTPTKEGVFAGKCAELCGTYHSAMLFNVHVVSPDEYDTYLQSLAAAGQTGEARGGSDAYPGGGQR